jgi:flavorubredoxin/flavin reductase (DIM6/NTAB) family NADH-FMN oxidoreductase RutF
MYCVKKVTEDLTWVGANDRRLAMFEGVYPAPRGVSYNSYFLNDEKTVLFDTVDKSVQHKFLENLGHVLEGREPDYFVVQHMEPDHSALIGHLAERYPGMKIVCNAKTAAFIKQFHDFDIDSRAHIVKERDTLNTGKHTLHFVMAPMVHWPEVMVTYDSTDKILFSADAFGCFGALNGALFADEIDFSRDYMDEARRYYTNIVGKYGQQVQTLLNKASSLEINMICPLHGFVWRKNKNIQEIVSKYMLWSKYEPEEYGVMIAYASVYGNTENAAEILSCRLRDKGVKTVMFDVSVTHDSEMVSAAFRWSHLVFASTTYNAGIFVTMESLINDLAAHNIQNRTVAIIENGSWAAASGGLIREKLSKCKNIKFIENMISVKSCLKAPQLSEIDAMANAIAATIKTAGADDDGDPPVNTVRLPSSPADITDIIEIEREAIFKLSCGLFVLTVKDNDTGKDNGCIINTVIQITDSPLQISVAVNQSNFTHDIIAKTGEFNISVLTESAPFKIFEQFGFSGGKDTDKFAGCAYNDRAPNGVRYVPEFTNGVISAKVTKSCDQGTHTLFVAEVVNAFSLSDEPSATYQYYFDNIKPKSQAYKNSEESEEKDKKSGFVCKICGYMYENNILPDDFICPLCKHGAKDFERF